VSLRKTANTPTNSSSRLDPYKDLMLLHVKGQLTEVKGSP